MIRTLIEVHGDSAWDHEQKLKAALDQLGYAPKPSEDRIIWEHDLYDCLRHLGLVPAKIVEKYRSDRLAIDLGREMTPNQASS